MGGAGTVFNDTANSWIWDVAHRRRQEPVLTDSVYPELNNQARPIPRWSCG